MAYSTRTLFCGPHGLRVRDLLSTPSEAAGQQFLGSGTVYYVHTARTAIYRACELLGLQKGNEVLAPAYNCGTEIDALRKSGVAVQLYEVDKSSYADLEELKKRITKKTKAIYVTHYFGFPQRLGEIRDICNQNKLYLIEDCALSLFSCDGHVKLGTIGDVSAFNFPKTLPVPDGGALVINDPNVAKDPWQLEGPSFLHILREMLPLVKRGVLRLSEVTKFFPLVWPLFRRDPRDACNESTVDGDNRPDIPASYYYDGRLTNKAISAITRYILRRCEPAAIMNKRRRNFGHYLSMIMGSAEVRPLFDRLPEGVCPLYFPVLVENRREVCQQLNHHSIAAMEWWSGYHREVQWEQYPNACFLKDNILVLPVHQQLEDRHVEVIAQKCMEIVGRTRCYRGSDPLRR